MWISGDALTSNAFKDARETITKIRADKKVTQGVVDELAKKKIFGIIDGGFWDNTGIINAVAAGSTEIYLFSDNWVPNLRNPFSQKEKHPSLAPLFQPPTDEAHALTQHQIFKEQDVPIDTQIANLKDLNLPSGTKKVQHLKVGTITAQTIDNPMVGINGGTEVKIHVLYVASHESIGTYIDFNDYGGLVGELCGILSDASNKDTVQGMLNSLVHGDNTFPGDVSAAVVGSVASTIDN